MSELNKLSTIVDQRLWEKDSTNYYRDVLKISDESAKIVPFVLNAHQLKVQDEIDKQRKSGVPVRIIVLKERKGGNSTHCLAQVYREVRFRPADALVVANDYDTTEYLFQIIHRFYNYSPESEKLPLESSNRRELHFLQRPDGREGGRILVETAGKKTAGRGFTPLYLLCSEAPYFENDVQVMNALLNSVPDTQESLVILEGTANGMGGFFFDTWQRASQGLSSYVPIFLCWKDLPKHTKKVHDNTKFLTSLTNYEKQIQARHDLTLGQLNWRRWCIVNKCGGDPEMFKQEYPLTQEEAFLSSGRGRFDRDALLKIVTTDGIRGYLIEEESYGSGKHIVFQPNREGWLEIWKRPINARKYCTGADVAEGIEIEGASSEDKYDWSIGDVFDRHTGEQVAQLRAQIEPDEFGRQLVLLGRWYNMAFEGVERNGNGETALLEMKHLGYPEALIYSRTHDTSGAKYSVPQLGWKTTVVSRQNLVNLVDRSLRDQSTIINSRRTIQEMLGFKIKPNGRVEAQEGMKDDAVFSYGIALMAMQHAQGIADEVTDKPPQEFKPQRYGHHNAAYNLKGV